MRCNKIVLISAAVTCLLIGIAYGQDWLGGGYVNSGGTNPDAGLAGMLGWLNQPTWYHTGGAIYPGPYGVYPYSPTPYYSDFRLNSLAGMNWEPFQKNWSETTNYARTKSSFRVYPISSSFNQVSSPPAAITGDTQLTVVSQGMRGYQVFLDGRYIGTEGTGGDATDGRFSYQVMGNQYHSIRVYDGRFNYLKSVYFQRSVPKIIYVEPGAGVYT